MNENTVEPIIDNELYELWSLTEDWKHEVGRKSWRSLCRIGTTIEKKNDQKRVEESRVLSSELEELAEALFEESNGLAHAKWTHENRVNQ